MILGLKRGEVRLVPYQPEWAFAFAREKKILATLLGPTALQIEHIGSTAVPEMPAKPVMDIAVAVRSLSETREWPKQLATEGYSYFGDRENRGDDFYAKGSDMTAKIASISFLAFLLLVIVTASSGQMPNFFHSLYAFPQGDRVGHIVLYGFLALLLTFAFPGRVTIARVRLPLVGACIWLFAAAEEWSQSLFTSRTADLVDLMCSTMGVAGGVWVAFVLKRSPISNSRKTPKARRQ